MKIAAVGTDGAYAVHGLPAGRYLVAPVAAMAPAWDAPESLETLRARAIAVALDEGERKAVDLIHPRGR